MDSKQKLARSRSAAAHSMTKYWMATAMSMEVTANRAMMRKENCSSVRLRFGFWASEDLDPALEEVAGVSTRGGSRMTVEL